MELDQKRIEDAIVQEVAERMIGDDELFSRVKTALDQRIDNHFKQSADAQIQAAIEAAVKNGLEHEYCKVSAFGQRVGEPTTVKAEIERMIAGYWNAKVGTDGKETSSSYNNSMTRAEYIMTKLVADDFNKEMKQHIVNLGGSLKDKLRQSVHETVNNMLSEVINVNSLGDQEAKNTGRACIDPKVTKIPA